MAPLCSLADLTAVDDMQEFLMPVMRKSVRERKQKLQIVHYIYHQVKAAS